MCRHRIRRFHGACADRFSPGVGWRSPRASRMATVPETRPCVAGRLDHDLVRCQKAFTEAFQRLFQLYRHDLPVEADLPPRKPLRQRFGEYLSRLRVACTPPIRSKDGSGGLHDNYGFSRSRRNRASRRGGQLLTRARSSTYENGLPATLRVPAPLSRMVTPYAAIPKTAARHRRRDFLSIPVTNAIERLHEEFKRRIKT